MFNDVSDDACDDVCNDVCDDGLDDVGAMTRDDFQFLIHIYK